MKLRGKTKVAVDIDVAVFRLFLTAFVNILLFLLRTVVHRRLARRRCFCVCAFVLLVNRLSLFIPCCVCVGLCEVSCVYCMLTNSGERVCMLSRRCVALSVVMYVWPRLRVYVAPSLHCCPLLLSRLVSSVQYATWAAGPLVSLTPR